MSTSEANFSTNSLLTAVCTRSRCDKVFDASHYYQSQTHDNQFEFFVIRLNPQNSFSSVSISHILSKTSRLHYPFSEILNLNGCLVTRINANYLKIAMWFMLLSLESLVSDQPETFIILGHLQNDTWTYAFWRSWYWRVYTIIRSLAIHQ